MKKIISIMLVLIMTMLVPMFGCSSGKEELSLNLEKVELSVYGEADIIASYKNVKEITWENDNQDVISMTEKGNYVRISALKAGVANIIAKSGDIQAKCAVIVGENNGALVVELDRKDDIEIRKGGKFYIPALAKIEGEAVEANIIYKTKDGNIATISDKGELEGKGIGQTELTVQAEYKGIRSAPIALNVTVKDGPVLSVTSTIVDIYENKLLADRDYYPSTATIETFIIDGNDEHEVVPKSIEYSQDGIVEYQGKGIVSTGIGSTIMTIKCEYNQVEYVAYVYIEVKKIPKVQINLNKTETILFHQAPSALYPSTDTLQATILIDGRTADGKAEWRVVEGNGAILVDSLGQVMTNSHGKGKIMASYDFGGKTYRAYCDILVQKEIEYLADGHKFWKRAGIYSTVARDKALVYENLEIANDENIPFVRLSLIPDKMLINDYSRLGTNVIMSPDNIGDSNMQFLFIKLSQMIDEQEKFVIFGMRIAKDGTFDSRSGNVRVGVTASTYAAEGAEINKEAVFGRDYNSSGINYGQGSCLLAQEIGWGVGLKASFFGKYLNDTTTNKYTLGLSMKGTAIYAINNDQATLIWDLQEDAKKFAEFEGNTAIPKKDNDVYWDGFNAGAVKMSIYGGSFYGGQNAFNVMLTDINGRPVESADADDMSIANI